jgi:hypothetical protein
MSEQLGKDHHWEGTPLQIVGRLDPYNIERIVIEFGNGDEEILIHKLGEEFSPYELYQAAGYIRALARDLHEQEAEE